MFSDVWLSLEKSIGEFSILYKKVSALIWLRAYNHDFGLSLVELYKFCLEYSGYAFVSRASCDMQISLQMVSNAHVYRLTVSL